ncbi:MAG: Hsp70 family protein, partial [Chlamydiales bacterium]
MRYLIGIDLGTTNCALAYVDTEKPHFPLQLFPISQLTALGKTDALSTLPSFCYLSARGEWPKGSLKLPWKEESGTFAGQFAKVQGARVPTRLVQSAKSWLCNMAANRRDKILPIDAADISQRLSPVEASANYLIHFRDAWNASMAKGDLSAELEEQEIILTVPASFDEVARSLTVDAARLAGFRHVTLLEEPQAAFYSWISQHEKEWQKEFKPGDRILVCDVGGGTTDFSLIKIDEKEGQMGFQRMAVGDHLLLGGDNMDAALAHYLEQKLQAQGCPPLDSNQWLQLLASAREAKEELLSAAPDQHEPFSVVIQGTGSAVVKGSLAISVQRSEVEDLISRGFFGIYPLSEALTLNRSRGFRTMGLPYEDEPSITKHLAHFLQQARCLEEDQGGVDYLLFNGGTMKPAAFQESILHSLQSWFPHRSTQVLPSINLNLAVARGAAYYGKVRRGMGVAIRGGLPRTYYLELEVKNSAGEMQKQAMTLLSRGSEEGHLFQPEQIFSLRANTPVAFNLFTSNVRLHDREGSLIEIDEQEMHRLPPIQTILRFGRSQAGKEAHQIIPVRLGIRLTAIGTVEIWLESQNTVHRWNLEFQLRSVTGQDNQLIALEKKQRDETFEAGFLEEAKQTIEGLFKGTIKPGQVMELLEGQLDRPRREWPPSVLRGLWETLCKCASLRKLSAEHDARWWNLAGFLLRPGFGYPLDDFRIKELWKIVLGELKAVKSPDVQIQTWICFRRIAGGLNKGQQMQIAGELTADLFDKKRSKLESHKKGESYAYSEKIRALAALERIDLPLKMRLGEALVDKIERGEAADFDLWALGRIGARHLFYGSAAQVIPKDTCAKWVEKLTSAQGMDRESALFMLSQLARKTDHRELNLPDSTIQKLLKRYPDAQLKERILEERSLTEKEQEQVFGESLPSGLVLELI